MKKVIILVSDYGIGLKAKINDFLENHTVTDIQYQFGSHAATWGESSTYSAMIVYEEE